MLCKIVYRLRPSQSRTMYFDSEMDALRFKIGVAEADPVPITYQQFLAETTPQPCKVCGKFVVEHTATYLDGEYKGEPASPVDGHLFEAKVG
jgi:hypothetical protein